MFGKKGAFVFLALAIYFGLSLSACLPLPAPHISVGEAGAVIAAATERARATATQAIISITQAAATQAAVATQVQATAVAPLTQQAVNLQLTSISHNATQSVVLTATAVKHQADLALAQIAQERAEAMAAQDWAKAANEFQRQLQRFGNGLVDLALVSVSFCALIGLAFLASAAFQAAWLRREMNLLATLRRLPNGELIRWNRRANAPEVVYRPDISPAAVPMVETIPIHSGGNGGIETHITRIDDEKESRLRQLVLEFLDSVLEYHARHPDYPRNRIPTKDELRRGGSWWAARTRPLARYLVTRSAGTAIDSGTFVTHPYRDVAELAEAVRRGKTILSYDQLPEAG